MGDDSVFNEAKGFNNPRQENPEVTVSIGNGDAIPKVNHIVFAAHVKDFVCKALVKI